jgi:alpha-tubulin suppressor-like RCC1 family protein
MAGMRALAVVLLVAGCTPIERAFHCTSSAQCVNAGAQGTCEPTGWCSFPDPVCMVSGRRYGTLVGDGLASQCVNQEVPVGCVSAMALGDAHGCALIDGGVQCWGKNDHGQLGNGTTNDAAAAGAVLDDHGAPLMNLTAVATGAAHSCALTPNQTIVCWGDDSSGQLGLGGSAAANPVPSPAAITTVVAIAAGAHHTCVALMSGAVWCWGANDAGQLGSTPPTGSNMPVEVVRAGLALDAVGVTAGATHSCALLRDHSMVCWGSNTDGELGNGATATTSPPVAVSVLGPHVTSAAGGLHFGCAVDDGAHVSCWGRDDVGQAGGTTPMVAVPTAISIDLVAAVSTGATRACARRSDGQLFCWGDGSAPAKISDGIGAFAVGPADQCSARGNTVTCTAFGDPHVTCP